MTTTSIRKPAASAVCCLLAAPMVIVAGELLHPTRSTDPARQLVLVAAHRQAWYVSHLLLFIGVALTIPAVTVLGALVRRQRPRLATAGVALAAAGAVCFAGLLTVGFVVGQMAAPGADRDQMSALFVRLFHSPGFAVPFEILPFLFAIGVTLLAIGLRRAEIISRPVAVCLGAGATALCLIGIVPGAPYAIAASAIFAAGMAPIGVHLLRAPQRRAAIDRRPVMSG